MMNPIVFTINIVIMCAMLTLLPSVAFAFANSTDGRGQPYWIVLRHTFHKWGPWFQ